MNAQAPTMSKPAIKICVETLERDGFMYVAAIAHLCYTDRIALDAVDFDAKLTASKARARKILSQGIEQLGFVADEDGNFDAPWFAEFLMKALLP